MAPGPDVTKPKDDADYFGRMTKAIFTAGLNWRMVENKWPAFVGAFSGFSPSKVSKLGEKDVRVLMKNQGIVRNERKIRATVENAKTVLALEKEFGSFGKYIDSFGGRKDRLQSDLQERFKHLGPSTARMFLWMVDYPLTPTAEEKAWLKGHRGHHD